MIAMGSSTTPGATRIVDTMSNVVYSDPGYLLFVRDETLLAQRFDLNRKALLDQPIVVTDRMGTGAGNGRAAFAASRNGVLAYRQQSGGVTRRHSPGLTEPAVCWARSARRISIAVLRCPRTPRGSRRKSAGRSAATSGWRR